jgi:ABC-type lipoprotein release transport system permease subunit
VIVGILGSVAVTRLLSGFLFGIKPTDPMTFLAVPLLLASIALLASYVPARRATKIDPMAALRCE